MDLTPDVFKILELVKQIDRAAFFMNVDANGYPAGFVDKDDERREDAYRRACAQVASSCHGVLT